MRFIWKKTKLDEEIDSLLEEMKVVAGGSPEYSAMASNLATLYSAKAKNAERRVKMDTVLLVTVSLAEVLLMLNKERTEIITSKALGFILKGRV